MIKKNLLTVLVVVVILAAGSMGYQHFKKEKDIKVHTENTFRQMTEAAKKSPRAGLDSMARAIKKYYLENKSYPESLNTLYPKYISSKLFIDGVNWDYERQGDNFVLNKSVTHGNQTRVASINKNLKIRLGTGAMFAMADQKTVAAPTTAKDTKSVLTAEISKPRPVLGLLPTGVKPLVAKKPKELILPPDKKEPAEEKIITYQSETGMDIIASGLSSEFLVWKNKDGTVGFGNIQYPKTGRIDYINVNGTWYKSSK